MFFLILAGVTGSVNLNIIGTVNTAVYISTGGEEEFGCGGALMYIGDEFRVRAYSHQAKAEVKATKIKE